MRLMMMSEMTFLVVIRNGGDFRVGIDTFSVDCAVDKICDWGLPWHRERSGGRRESL